MTPVSGGYSIAWAVASAMEEDHGRSARDDLDAASGRTQVVASLWNNPSAARQALVLAWHVSHRALNARVRQGVFKRRPC
jgi:hypothetical protein